EHPVPYLPNIRLGQTNLTHDGFGVLHFLGTDYAFRGTIDLSHTDVTGYYEVLDNIVSLDLGLTARIFDGEIKTDFIASTIPLDSVYALLYANVQVDIPATGLALGAIMNVGDNG